MDNVQCSKNVEVAKIEIKFFKQKTMKTENPFTSRGSIVENSQHLIGRATELKKLKEHIFEKKTYSNIALVSEKRMGATSLAFQAKDGENENVVVVTIYVASLQKPEDLFYLIIKEISNMLNEDKYYDFLKNFTKINNNNWSDIYSECKNFLNQLKQNQIKAVCILEEFDAINTLFQNKISYFQALREIAYNPNNRLSLITVSSRDIEMIEAQVDGILNLLQIFDEIIYLKPFNTTELNQYFELFNSVDIKITERNKDKIIYYTGGCPYLLNVLCYEITEIYFQINKLDIKQAFEKVENNFNYYFRSITRHFKEEERYEILIKILNNETEQISKQQIKDFEKTGLIFKKNNRYRLFSNYYHELFISEEKRIINDETIEFQNQLSNLSLWLENTEDYKKLDFNILTKHFAFAKEIIDITKNDTFENKNIKELKEKLEKFNANSENILISKPATENIDNCKIAISKIVIKNYFQIENVEITDISLQAKWIFLTGENGFGKTLFLQAITAALNGEIIEWGGGKLIKSQDFNVALELIENNEIFLINYRNPFFTRYEKFAAYGPYRLQIQQVSSKNENLKNGWQPYSIFNTGFELLSIEREMLDLHKTSTEGNIKDGEKLNEIKNVFIKLLDNYITEIKTTGTEVKYLEAGQELYFKELASGMKSIIAMIGDMIIRLYATNYNTIKISDLTGIVIIDEIELHLHVKLQRKIPNLLSQIFPNVLFIASTHSPIPLLGAPQNSVVIKVERNKIDNLIHFEKFDGDFKRLLPNALLTSDIFDFNEILPETTEIENVDTADNYNESKRRNELRAKLGIINILEE